MSMFGRDLLGNVRMRIVHFDFIYAQKDSFAHRYGFYEICGCVPLDLGCFGPVARSRRANAAQQILQLALGEVVG